MEQLVYLPAPSSCRSRKKSKRIQSQKPRTEKTPKLYRDASTQTAPPSVRRYLGRLRGTLQTFPLPMHALENAPSVSTQKRLHSPKIVAEGKNLRVKSSSARKKLRKPLYIKGNSQADLIDYGGLQDVKFGPGDIELAEEAIIALCPPPDGTHIACQTSSSEFKSSSSQQYISQGGFIAKEAAPGKRTVSTWTTTIPITPSVSSPRRKKKKKVANRSRKGWVQSVATERGYHIKNDDQGDILRAVLDIFGFRKILWNLVKII